MPRTETVVPTARATVSRETTPPRRSYVRRVATSSDSVRVVTVSSESAQREESASPRKPKEFRESKSSKAWILDVAYFCVRASWFSGETPVPLSTTSMDSAPWSLSRISMFVAPASSAFSTSSFTAPARSSTTCPLQMRWIGSLLMGRMAPAAEGRAGFDTIVEERGKEGDHETRAFVDAFARPGSPMPTPPLAARRDLARARGRHARVQLSFEKRKPKLWEGRKRPTTFNRSCANLTNHTPR